MLLIYVYLCLCLFVELFDTFYASLLSSSDILFFKSHFYS